MGRSSSGYSQEQPFSHIVVVGEEAVVVESWGGVSVFAHQRGLGECPSWWGSVMVADWWRRGWWWGCRSAQCPYCCPPPQHRGAQLVILYLSKAEGEGVGQPQKRDGCTRESTEVLLRARCKLWQLKSQVLLSGSSMNNVFFLLTG